MEQIKIDLQKVFTDQLCSFDVAKKAKEAGMNCSNTFYAFDEKGAVNDGAWMENEEMIKQQYPTLKNFTAPVLFPAINLAMAIGMLEDTDLEFPKLNVYQFGDKFFIKYKDETYQSEKLVDVVVLIWCKHKKKQ